MSKSKPKTDYVEDWDDFSSEVTGEKDTSKKKKESESSLPPCMFFDFRRGKVNWPAKCELVSHEKAVEEIQRVKDTAIRGDIGDDSTGVTSSDVKWGAGILSGAAVIMFVMCMVNPIAAWCALLASCCGAGFLGYYIFH